MDLLCRAWVPHRVLHLQVSPDVPFGESQLCHSTVGIIRLLKQGICNLCFPAMVTAHRVNQKGLLF